MGPLRGQDGVTQTEAGVKAGGYWKAGSGWLSAPALHSRNWGEAAPSPRGFSRHTEQAARCTRTQRMTVLVMFIMILAAQEFSFLISAQACHSPVPSHCTDTKSKHAEEIYSHFDLREEKSTHGGHSVLYLLCLKGH